MNLVKLAVSDPAQLPSLRDWLRAQPDVVVRLESGAPRAGELGADDIVALASSGGLIAAIKTLPDFIRSRSRKIKIEATVGDKKFSIDTTNVDDVIPILEKLLDD